MASQKHAANAMEIDRLATQLAKDPHSKAFLPLAEEYCKVGMWEEAVSVLEAGIEVLSRLYHRDGRLGPGV